MTRLIGLVNRFLSNFYNRYNQSSGRVVTTVPFTNKDVKGLRRRKFFIVACRCRPIEVFAAGSAPCSRPEAAGRSWCQLRHGWTVDGP